MRDPCARRRGRTQLLRSRLLRRRRPQGRHGCRQSCSCRAERRRSTAASSSSSSPPTAKETGGGGALHAGIMPPLANMPAHLRAPTEGGNAPMVAERPAAVVGRAAPAATDAGRLAPAVAADEVPGRTDGDGSGAVAANAAASAPPSSSSSRGSMRPPPPPGCFSPTRRAGLSAVGSDGGAHAARSAALLQRRGRHVRTCAAPVVDREAVRGKSAATVLARHEPVLRVALKGGFVPLVRVDGAP